MVNKIMILLRVLIFLSSMDVAMSQSGVRLWTSTSVSNGTVTNVSTNTANATNGNPPTATTVGPTKTEWLTMTFLGIHKLENEEEWSKRTAEFVTKFIFGAGNVHEATINISDVKQQPLFKTRDDSCGCLQCTPEVWSRDACDENGFCSTCGERIAYTRSEGKTQREACSQIAGLEFDESCGSCNPLTCNQHSNFCGCPQCTSEVWSTETCDDNGFCSTCGERITYLHSEGESERDACIQVAGLEYEESCGPCNPLVCNEPTTFCGCPECTEEVWTSKACDKNGFCSTCGERIDFLQMLGQTEREACIQISGNEHHDPCGQCNPLLCSPTLFASRESSDPSFLSDISVKVTYSQTSTYKTANQLITPSYVIHAPFAEKVAQSEYIEFLQSQLTGYNDIISVSHGAVSPAAASSPPPFVDVGNVGGPDAKNIIIAIIAGLYALVYVLREIVKLDEYDAGPPDQYHHGQYPEQRPPWRYPSEASDGDSEDMDDDATSPRETDSLRNGNGSQAFPEDHLVEEDDDCCALGSFEPVGKSGIARRKIDNK